MAHKMADKMVDPSAALTDDSSVEPRDHQMADKMADLSVSSTAVSTAVSTVVYSASC